MTEQQFIEWSWIFSMAICMPIAVYLTMFTNVSGDTVAALVLAGMFGPFIVGLLAVAVWALLAYGGCALIFYGLRELGKKLNKVV